MKANKPSAFDRESCGTTCAHRPRKTILNVKLSDLKLFAAACLMLMIMPAVIAADAVRVPGTRTRLVPPDGFAPAERFPGFQRADLQSSIMVTELPAPAGDMIRGMTKERLATQGMTLLSSSPHALEGRQALLLHVAQQAAGTEFLKWMLITGDQKNALMVVGTFPKAASGQVGHALRDALLSVSWAPGNAIDPLEGLTFRITPTSRLQFAGRLSGMILLSESGSMQTTDPTEGLYVASASVGEGRITDLQAFSETRARLTGHLKDLEVLEGRHLQLDELPAYELIARANDVQSGTAMQLYQVVVQDGDGYFIIQGLVGAARAPDFLPEFRRVTSSFRKVSAD